MATPQNSGGQRGVAFLLVLFCLDGHLGLGGADHHPFCQSNCARVKLRAIRIDCLLSCDQELAGVFYRAGRRDFSSASSYLGGDEERDEGESIEVPFDDVVLREPRDRSAFVRIGKRDVSSLVAKRRDEFVRIGKGEPRHISRAPFLLSRTYSGLGDMDGAEKQLLDQPAEIGKRKTVLVPVSGSIKRPSAFVRIGKREKPEDITEEDTAGGDAGTLLVRQPNPTDGSSEYGGIGRAGADDLYPRADDTQGEQVDKKASAFVRIGRRRGAAFVRIGKSDPSVKKWEEQEPAEAKPLRN